MSKDTTMLVGMGLLLALGLWLFTKNRSSQNAETWQVERDPTTGRLMGITVHREVNQR